MTQNEPFSYEANWDKFQKKCERRAKKADCVLTNKCWRRLREWHLENYLSSLENPYGFLFEIRLRHKKLYQRVHCMPKFYMKYSQERQKQFASQAGVMVEFPTWRRNE